MSRRSSLLVRRIRQSDAEEQFPALTVLEAALRIRATRPRDSLELLQIDLLAGLPYTADGVLYFADVVDTLPKEPNR